MSKSENDFLECLVVEMHDILINVAKIRLHDDHSAYDVVQETYLAAQKKISKLMKSENPQGWLVEALKFKIKHEQRAKGKYLLLTQKIAQDVSTDKQHEDRVDYDVGDLLLKSEYEVLRYLYIEGLSIKEVSEKLDISYEACKKRVQAAKRKLAQELK